MLTLNPVTTEISPRLHLTGHANSGGQELPISGGWGYSKDDACIINRADPIVDQDVPFNGVAIENIFIEKRIYEEMVTCRPEGEKFSGIEWSMLKQESIDDGAVKFDKLTVEIRAFPEKDWAVLKAEYEGPDGVSNPAFNHQAHESKRQSKLFFVTREFWFDITGFCRLNPKSEKIALTCSEPESPEQHPDDSFQFTTKQRKWWQFW